MACCKALCSIPLIRRSSSALFSVARFSSFSPSHRPLPRARRVTLSASASSIQDSTSTEHPSSSMKRSWKPTCLYYTQGKCTMMDDPVHLDKFSHSCSVPLEGNVAQSRNLRSQHVDFFLVLDLEGKVEILEFPVIMVDATTMEVVNFFHRFVRPSNMSEQRINEYIEGKYGKLGVDRVWHDTAMPFVDVIREFEAWMTHHNLWRKELHGPLQKAAFVTCGNWDIKTKIPQQCQVSGMKIPPYFMEWINLKDVYLNFYNQRAPGMRSMLNELELPLVGSHHLGIDDTKNIVRVLQKMLADGALIQTTARRDPTNPKTVEFLFKNRIRVECAKYNFRQNYIVVFGGKRLVGKLEKKGGLIGCYSDAKSEVHTLFSARTVQPLSPFLSTAKSLLLTTKLKFMFISY